MAQPFPYTYYSCPCTSNAPQPSGRQSSEAATPGDDEERTFDPRSPRANFSLFPLEHLLYCTECHQIRCDRCTAEEVVCWYCPGCLFEVPSSTVRSEGNRCSRSCYNCPLCTSPLTISSFADQAGEEGPSAPFVLSCPFCNWTSLEVGITFDSSKNISGQLAKTKNGGDKIQDPPGLSESRFHPSGSAASEATVQAAGGGASERYPTKEEDMFWKLSQFYKGQMADSDVAMGYGGSGASDFSFASPTAVARLLNMYSGTGRKSRKTKPTPMREALAADEGLQVFDPSSEAELIEGIRTRGWDATTSQEQRHYQDKRYNARFVDELRPMATLLRTKRSKRCKACRTLLVRPEPKVSSTRYKIKVLALNNIPKVAICPLGGQVAAGSAPVASGPAQLSKAVALTPLLSHQFLLTLTNPLFDPILITLATPAVTPGRIQTRVTILCPQFEVGANSDIWDEALGSAGATAKSSRGRGGSVALREESKVAEAGKVWEQGRNWTSVVVEVVPGVLPGQTGSMTGPNEVAELDEDEDVVEMGVFVRMEYETSTEGAGDEAAHRPAGAAREHREEREVAFWCVLGLGKIP